MSASLHEDKVLSDARTRAAADCTKMLCSLGPPHRSSENHPCLERKPEGVRKADVREVRAKALARHDNGKSYAL